MSTELATIPLNAIGKNPHRDFAMATMREDTVAGLMASINSTDFWQNFPVRVKDNTLVDGTVITEQAQIEALFTAKHDWSQEKFEIPHGHHRLEALKRLEWTEVSLLVKVITDELMLRMMAEENKEGYGGNCGVTCETVEKVTKEINSSLANAADYAAYKADGGTLFGTKKAFDNAKTDGVGFRKVRDFLGQTWSESDIRGAFKILKLIGKNYFTREDVGSVASMGLLETVGAMGEYIYEGKKDVPAPDMPTYWKRDILNEIVDRCSPDNKGWEKVTVAQLRRARTLFEKDGINPVSFLRNGNSKGVFDVIKATKTLLFDPDKSEETNYSAVDGLAQTDGFEDYKELNGLQEKVKASMKASFARLAKGETADEEETLEPTTEANLQEALDAEGSGDVIVPDLFGGDTPEEGGEVVPLPTSRIIETYTQTAAHIGHGSQMLLADLDNLGDDVNLDAAISTLLSTTIKLGIARLGRDSIVKIFNKES